jgi:cytochrome c oxidase assembly factor CtaG
MNLFALLVYFHGWRTLRAAMPRRFTPSRLISFIAGIAALEIALASPIDTFDPFLLADHMLQHMILVMVVPPLILLGDPAIPLLHGLPLMVSRDALGPFLSWTPLQRLGRRLTHPAVAWLLMALAMLGWHIPAAYEFALHSPDWHEVEHACFLVASLLFWWPVIQPWPSRAQWPRWTMPLYLLLADFVNSALSAFRALSVVRHRAEARRNFRTERSGRCRSEHVGNRVIRVFGPGGHHHGEIAVAFAPGTGIHARGLFRRESVRPLGVRRRDDCVSASSDGVRLASSG